MFGIFTVFKSLFTGPKLFSTTAIIAVGVAIIVALMSINGIMSKLGFLNTKDKLLVENTSQENVIKTLTAENLAYKQKLDQCNALSTLNNSITNTVNSSITANNQHTQNILTDKENQINAIMQEPDVVLSPSSPDQSAAKKSIAAPVPKETNISVAKQREISQVQINSLWSSYNAVIGKQ